MTFAAPFIKTQVGIFRGTEVKSTYCTYRQIGTSIGTSTKVDSMAD